MSKHLRRRCTLLMAFFCGLVLFLAWISFGDATSNSFRDLLGLSRSGGGRGGQDDSDGTCNAGDDSAPPSVYQRLWSSVSSTARSLSRSSTTSSLLRIDPSRIVSTIAEYGGFLLPSSFQNDLKVLQAVCHCESTFLDMATRELQIFHFRVDSPSRHAKWPAVEMGQFRLGWDSYLSPCVHLELHNVTVVVEFDNLWLSRNNWNELSEAGFPPPLEALFVSKKEEEMRQKPQKVASDQDEFVRIGSLSLKGNVRLRLWSRPLGESLLAGDDGATTDEGGTNTDITLSLESLRGLMDRIRRAAEDQERLVGRRGCTSTQLYEILQSYFVEQLKHILFQVASRQLEASGGNDDSIIKAARKWTMDAGKTVEGYATRAFNKAEDTVISRVRDSLSLLPEEDKEQMFSSQEIKTAWRSSVPHIKGWLSRQVDNLNQVSMAPNEMSLQETAADGSGMGSGKKLLVDESRRESKEEESRTKTLQPQEIQFADW